MDSHNKTIKNKVCLSIPFKSKEDFERECRKLYNEKTKTEELYFQILTDLESAIREDKFDHFVRISTLISYITSTVDQECLKSYYNNVSNPIKSSNLIILASKYNKVKFVEYLFDGQTTLLNNLSIDIGRTAILPSDEDEARHNAFYYAMTLCEVDLLETLVNKWPSNYFITHSEELDEILSKTYEDLKLKNVNLSIELDVFVQSKVIDLRFFSNNYEKGKCDQSTLNNIIERIDLILQNIELLKSNVGEVNESFLFTTKFIAQNIQMLKRQIKSTYARLPWEEMEFCLISFVFSYTKKEDINLFYHTVLSKSKIINHLENFSKQLKTEKTNIQDMDGNKRSALPKTKREIIVSEIIKNCPQFEDLYDDYNQIIDIYSLKKMSYYINSVTRADHKEKEGQILITRALQLIGEYLKNTLESPKLSETTSDLLLLSLSNNSRKVITNLRDSLSHSQSLFKRIEIEENQNSDFFLGILNDTKKIGSTINDVLSKYRIKMIRILIQQFIDSENIVEVKNIIEIFRYAKLDKEVANNITLIETEKLEKLINDLSKNLENKTKHEQDIFTRINSIISLEKSKSENDETNYIMGFAFIKTLALKLSNVHIDNNIFKTSKVIANKILLFINSKTNPHSLKEVAYLLQYIFHLIKSRPQGNIDQIRRIFYEIWFIVEFEAGKIKWIEELKQKIKIHSRIFVFKNTNNSYKDKYQNDLALKLSELRRIFEKNAISNKFVENLNFLKNNKKLQGILEMLLLDIMSILGSRNCLENNDPFVDDYSPLLTGKCLRNYLAHGNPLFDILVSDPLIAIILNAKKLTVESKIINKKIGKPVYKDTSLLKNKFNQSLDTIKNKENMFTAAEKGNLDGLKRCLESGADVNARSFNFRTTLHFAAKGTSLKVFKFLVDQNVQINMKDVKNQTPLHLAAAYGRKDIVEFLVKEKRMPLEDLDINGRTPLHLAAQNGQKAVVNILLRNNASTVTKDAQGLSPLHYAIENNHIGAVLVLLQKEQNFDINTGISGCSPLHLAAEKGYLRLVHLLLKNKANVNAKNDVKLTPLHFAAQNGCAEVFDAIISNGADISATDIFGYTPLHYAVEQGHEEIVNALLKHGADVNVAAVINNITPLHYAAKGGYEKILKNLLENEADANASTTKGITPLHFAATNGHIGIVNSLLQHGGNVNVKSKTFQTPLHIAAFNGHKDVVALLIQHKAEVNAQDIENRIPLLSAIFNGSVDIVDLLIKNNAQINAKDKRGFTPLHAAVINAGKDVVDLLIKNEAKINVRSNDGYTPLHMAARKEGNTDIFELLIKNKANVNLKTENGFTPLHIAANCCRNVVNILIKNRADVNCQTNDGCTPLHIAVLYYKKDIIDILLKNKADINAKETEGNTPLHMAVGTNDKQLFTVQISRETDNNVTNPNNQILGRLDYKEIINLLIKNGANVNAENNKCITPLFASVLNNCKEIVSLLLAQGANVNANNELLSLAIYFGFKDVANILIQKKAHINIKCFENNITPLHTAVSKGEKEIVKALISKGAKVDAKNNMNDTPLLFAAERGYEEIVKILIAKGADINSKSTDEMTPLHTAAGNGHINIVKTLLDEGVEVHVNDNMNRKPVELAVSYGHLEVVKALLEHTKININFRGNGSFTMLHIAAQEGRLEVTRYLMENGANMNERNISGSKPIHIASREGFTNIVKYFLDLGLSVDEPGAQNQSLLHYTALEGKLEVAQFLIQRGGNVNGKDINGLTPLHVAAILGKQEFVEFSLRNGAIYNAVDKYYKEPLYIAKHRGIYDLLKSTHKLFTAVQQNNISDIENYIKEGAVVNAKIAGGLTPLHIAAQNGFVQLVKILLKNGADPNTVSDARYTPLHHTSKCSHLKVVKILLSNGAKYNPVTNSAKTPVEFATDKNIITLFKRINESFEKVKNHDCSVIDDLRKIKNNETLKAITNAQDKENKTLIVRAVDSNFEKIEQLKRVGLPDDVFIDLELASLLCSQQKYQEALSIYRRLFEKNRSTLGANSIQTLEMEEKIAEILFTQQNFQTALDMFESICNKQTNVFGRNSEVVLNTRNTIALLLHRLGKNQEALNIYKDIIKKQKELLGVTHLDVLSTQTHMALVFDKLQEYEEALSMNYDTYDKYKELLGLRHPATLTVQNNIAMVLNNKGESDEALSIYRNVYKSRKQILGPFHPNTMRTLRNLTGILINKLNYEEAFKTYQELYDNQKAVLGPNHLDTLDTQNNIANILYGQGKIFAALKNFKESLDKRKVILGPDHPEILHTVRIMETINLIIEAIQ